MIEAAQRALADLDRDIDPAEPLRFAIRRAAGGTSITDLLDFLVTRAPGGLRGNSRYRWELSHQVGVRMPRYAPSERAWTAWRAGEERALAKDPFEVERRLLVPVILAETLDALLASDDPRAATFLDEATPIARRDLARYIAVNDSWEDTWALWCIARRPRVLAHVHSLAVALAVSYAAGAKGPVLGIRFPYYEKPLPSASAHLGTALLSLGLDLDVAARLAGFVADARRPSGGWGDDDEREDPLTTFVCADLLARIAPSFDLQPTLAYFAGTQGDDGLWRSLGPEAPWLSAEIVALARAAAEPFAARFRWPHCSHIDHKTGAPFFAHFVDVANLLASAPGLAAAPIELAFIDLIGFRAFNNRYGQDAGDDVLARFAAELATIGSTRAIRDGGDEFLVVGAPDRTPLEPDVRAFMVRWKAAFHARFGADVPAVIPRVVIGRATGAELRALRQDLGRRITALKELPSVPDVGIVVVA